MITGSLHSECDKRLGVLYKEKHRWLVSEAKKLTKNREEAEDLVSELYEYLHLKCNPNIFWGESYNIFYCNKFFFSRFMNKTKKLNRTILSDDVYKHLETEEDVPYDIEYDESIEQAHNDVLEELKRLSVTRMWPSSKIFELYWMSSDTLEETANKIGISKSTTFLAVKKVRKYLKEIIPNPFKDE